MTSILIIYSLLITGNIYNQNTQLLHFSPSKSQYSSRTTNITHTHDYHFESQFSLIDNKKDIEEKYSGIFSIIQTEINILTPSNTTDGTSKRIKGRQNAIEEDDKDETEPNTHDPNGNIPNTPIGDIPWLLTLTLIIVYTCKLPIHKLKIP